MSKEPHIHQLIQLDNGMGIAVGPCYKTGEEYEWHKDAETFKASDIKLTALINISENSFSGGEFNLLNSKNVTLAPELSNPGSMIVFNSFILHKVDPIIKGTRKTLTFFAKGPAFK